jgi:hypothetical protein
MQLEWHISELPALVLEATIVDYDGNEGACKGFPSIGV